jgi:predicted phosphodiesterase
VRALHPKNLRFDCEGLDVLMTHIGGYPGKYAPEVRAMLKEHPPGLFICGHSHILKVMPDPKNGNLLHLNPGAAGRHGFHQMRTMLRFEVLAGKVQHLQVIELGKRA